MSYVKPLEIPYDLLEINPETVDPEKPEQALMLSQTISLKNIADSLKALENYWTK